MELLRAIARGDDAGGRVTEAIVAFTQAANRTDARLYDIVNQTLSQVYADALECRDEGHIGEPWKDVLPDALKLTAENIAQDSAAKGRRSRRMSELERAVEQQMLEKEERSREYGGSYLRRLADRLPKKPRTPTAAEKRGAENALKALDEVIAELEQKERDQRLERRAARERAREVTRLGRAIPAHPPKRRPAKPEQPEDGPYLASLGATRDDLLSIIGDPHRRFSTVDLYELMGPISKRTRRRLSMTEIRDRLIPVLRRDETIVL